MSASSKMVKLNFVGIIGSECWSLEVGWFCAFQKVIKNGLIVCSCASWYVLCVVFEEILCYHVFDMTRNLMTREFFQFFEKLKISFKFSISTVKNIKYFNRRSKEESSYI